MSPLDRSGADTQSGLHSRLTSANFVPSRSICTSSSTITASCSNLCTRDWELTRGRTKLIHDHIRSKDPYLKEDHQSSRSIEASGNQTLGRNGIFTGCFSNPRISALPLCADLYISNSFFATALGTLRLQSSAIYRDGCRVCPRSGRSL